MDGPGGQKGLTGIGDPETLGGQENPGGLNRRSKRVLKVGKVPEVFEVWKVQ